MRGDMTGTLEGLQSTTLVIFRWGRSRGLWQGITILRWNVRLEIINMSKARKTV